MDISLQLLRAPEQLRKTLLQDGWRLHREYPDSFRATHPAVPDEVAARIRLDRLGLLTSSSLRVSFRYGR